MKVGWECVPLFCDAAGVGQDLCDFRGIALLINALPVPLLRQVLREVLVGSFCRSDFRTSLKVTESAVSAMDAVFRAKAFD